MLSTRRRTRLANVKGEVDPPGRSSTERGDQQSHEEKSARKLRAGGKASSLTAARVTVPPPTIMSTGCSSASLHQNALVKPR